MKNLHFILLIVSLVATSVATFCYKWLVLDFPITEEEQATTWDIEAKLNFYGSGKGTKISLFIPQSDAGTVILDESFISPGYGVAADNTGQNRKATWSVRRASGKQTLYYKAKIAAGARAKNTNKLAVSTDTKSYFSEPTLIAARSLLQRVSEHASDIDTLVQELGKELNATSPQEEVHALLGKKRRLKDIPDVLIALLALKNVPAMKAHGIELRDGVRDAEIVQWIEVWDQQERERKAFNTKGKRISLESMITWWFGNDPLVYRNGGRPVSTQISLVRNQEQALNTALESGTVRKSKFLEYSLFRLPVSTQLVYRILFLIPIGTLVVVFMRNVIGMVSFGTFMPILIALGFRETELAWGVVLFCAVVFAGLAARFYLEQFKLLLVPRLASSLTIVVITMLLFSIAAFKMDITHGLSIALFPMVILTMAIERMSITWDEKGAPEAFKQGAGTLFISCLCYLLMGIREIEHLLFVFPELLLGILAVNLMLGRYTGFRLFEVMRFRELSSIEYNQAKSDGK